MKSSGTNLPPKEHATYPMEFPLTLSCLLMPYLDNMSQSARLRPLSTMVTGTEEHVSQSVKISVRTSTTAIPSPVSVK